MQAISEISVNDLSIIKTQLLVEAVKVENLSAIPTLFNLALIAEKLVLSVDAEAELNGTRIVWNSGKIRDRSYIRNICNSPFEFAFALFNPKITFFFYNVCKTFGSVISFEP